MRHRIHRVLALILGLFLVTHIGVHLFALGGPNAHHKALGAIQWIYRNPVIEPLLILAIILQVYTGIRFVLRRCRETQNPFWAWAQIISGLYLAMFFLLHTSAALSVRHIFDLDTNFYWVAGTVLTEPLLWGFRPYYFFGILSVFTHLAAVLYFRLEKPLLPMLLMALGVVLGLIIVAAVSGLFFHIDLPQNYIDFYETYTDLSR